MRVNIKYTIKENFIASKGNKSDLHLGEFSRKFQTPVKFWNEKVTGCGEFSEFCWQWGIGWRLGPASGAPVQPLGGDEASRNEGGGGWVRPPSPSPPSLNLFWLLSRPRPGLHWVMSAPGTRPSPAWPLADTETRTNGQIKIKVGNRSWCVLQWSTWYVWYHAAFWRLRLNQNKISNPFSSIVRMSDLQSCYISTSAASVIHENFTLLKIVFYPKLKLSSPNSTCYVRIQF